MAKTREDFLPDVGGFLDGIPGDIVDAIFEVASGEYADRVMLGGDGAKVPIVLSITVESPKLEKPAKQNYSVGSQEQWEIADGGKSIINLKNADKHSFRDGSLAMELVKAMADCIGNGDMEKGQDFFAKRDYYMTDAEFYTGLSFDWEVKTITREIGKKTVTSKPPLPVTFLGEVGATAAPAKKTAAKPAAKASAKVDNDTAELDQIIIDNASGKDAREIKTFAVKQAAIKANDVYMKSIVSGKRLKEMEDNGDLVKDPDTGKYL